MRDPRPISWPWRTLLQSCCSPATMCSIARCAVSLPSKQFRGGRPLHAQCRQIRWSWPTHLDIAFEPRHKLLQVSEQHLLCPSQQRNAQPHQSGACACTAAHDRRRKGNFNLCKGGRRGGGADRAVECPKGYRQALGSCSPSSITRFPCSLSPLIQRLGWCTKLASTSAQSQTTAPASPASESCSYIFSVFPPHSTSRIVIL